jgi:hypothetical protein
MTTAWNGDHGALVQFLGFCFVLRRRGQSLVERAFRHLLYPVNDMTSDVGGGYLAFIWRNDDMIGLCGIRMSWNLGQRSRSDMVTNSASSDLIFNELL